MIKSLFPGVSIFFDSLKESDEASEASKLLIIGIDSTYVFINHKVRFLFKYSRPY